MNRLFLVAALVGAPAIAHAQGVVACRDALVRDVAVSNTSMAERISILRTITREQFEEATKNMNHSGDVVVYGIPIKGTWDWNQFDSARKRYISEYKFDADFTATESLKTIYLSARAPEAYATCIRGLESGLYAWLENAAPNSLDAIVRVKFNTSKYDTTPRTIDVVVSQGTYKIGAEASKRMSSFVGPTEEAFNVRRDSLTNDTTVIVSVSNSEHGSAVLTIPATPRIWAKRMQSVALEKTFTVTGSKPHQQIRNKNCLPANKSDLDLLADGTLDPDRETIEATPSGSGGDHAVVAESKRAQNYCVTTNVGIDGDGHRRVVIWHMMAVGEKPRWVLVDSEGRDIMP